MAKRVERMYAVSTPRWSWCDTCNLTTLADWDFLSITPDGVTVLSSGSGCVKEYRERKARVNGV